jgi:hypothetical protein
MALQNRSKSVTVDECRDFLEAVVNDRPGLRSRYAGWLAPLCSPHEYELLRNLYGQVPHLWTHVNVKPPRFPEKPDEAYLTLLRHRLRVIWERAASGNNPKAPVMRLWTQIRQIEHERYHLCKTRPWPPDFHSPWLRWTEQSLEWLSKNTHKLLRCRLPECRKFPYFIRTKPHQKYCSETCSALAERKRVVARSKRPNKSNRLSNEGRARISAGVKKRWEEYRIKSAPPGKHNAE